MGRFFKSKAEKEQEHKMLVKQAIRELEKRIAKLRSQEQVYIEAAQVAMREDLPDQVKLAKEALRLTISEEKRTYKMLLNAKIIAQMKDMTESTGQFLEVIRVISKDISGATTQDVTKLSGELRMAMEKVSAQTENLNDLMVDSQDDITDFSAETKLITDEEIDRRIYGTAAPAAGAEGQSAAAAPAGEGGTDPELDAEISELTKYLR